MNLNFEYSPCFKFIQKCLVIFLLQHMIQIRALSQELPSIQTDRPDQTESPFIVPKKHWQIETGFSYEKIDENNKACSHPSILLKYGVNDNFEFRLIPEYVTLHSQNQKTSGITPLTFGFKVKLAEEKGIFPVLSFIGHIGTTIASDNLKTSWYAPAFRFTMQHTLSQKVSLGYNVGAEWNGETPDPAFIYTLTTGYSITDKFGCYAELYGFLVRKSNADHRADAGLTYVVKKNMMFDISGGFGINKYAPAYYVAIGYSIRLKD